MTIDGNGRSRVIAAGLAVVAATLVAAYLALWMTAVTPLRERGTDFSATYVAAQQLRDGHGAGLYDQSAEARRHAQLLPPGTSFDLPFLTPPSTALLALPLTTLDAGAAFRVFSVIQFLLLLTGTVAAARAAPWPESAPASLRNSSPLLGVAGVATAVMLLLGQWDGLNALGIGMAYAAWRRGRGAQAATWLVATAALAKPHLAIGLLAFIVGRRRPREIVAAALGGVAALALWLAISGTSGVTDFVSGLGSTLGHTAAASTLGLSGLLSSWLGASMPTEVAAIVLGVAAIGACTVLGQRSHDAAQLEVTLAATVALSLLATPHLLAHDLVLLAPPLVWMLARAAASDALSTRGHWPGPTARGVLGAWLLLNFAVALDAGNGAAAPPGRLVPWVLLGLGLVALLLRAGLR